MLHPAQTQNLSLKKKKILSNPTKKNIYTETIRYTKLALSAVTRLFTSPIGAWTWRIVTGSIHPTVPLNPSQTCCKKARFKQPFFVKSEREARHNQSFVSCRQLSTACMHHARNTSKNHNPGRPLAQAGKQNSGLCTFCSCSMPSCKPYQ